VTIMFFWLRNPELAIRRVALRAVSGGHSVPEETIRRRYEQGIDNLKKIYIPICDFWILVDNSDTEGKRVAQGGLRVPLKVYNERIYERFLSQIFES